MPLIGTTFSVQGAQSRTLTPSTLGHNLARTKQEHNDIAPLSSPPVPGLFDRGCVLRADTPVPPAQGVSPTPRLWRGEPCSKTSSTPIDRPSRHPFLPSQEASTPQDTAVDSSTDHTPCSSIKLHRGRSVTERKSRHPSPPSLT